MSLIIAVVIAAAAGFITGVFFMRIKANATKVEDVVNKAKTVEEKAKDLADAIK